MRGGNSKTRETPCIVARTCLTQSTVIIQKREKQGTSPRIASLASSIDRAVHPTRLCKPQQWLTSKSHESKRTASSHSTHPEYVKNNTYRVRLAQKQSQLHCILQGHVSSLAERRPGRVGGVAHQGGVKLAGPGTRNEGRGCRTVLR